MDVMVDEQEPNFGFRCDGKEDVPPFVHVDRYKFKHDAIVCHVKSHFYVEHMLQ